MNDRMVQEILDRTRRMETRLTKFLEEQGFDTKVRRPVWRSGEIIIPSMACSFKDAMSVVPDTWGPDRPIAIVHHDEVTAYLHLP